MKKTLALLSFALLLYACGSKKTETDSSDATAMAGESVPANQLTEQQKADGWKLLFDGQTMTGWRNYKNKENDSWEVLDGMLHCKKVNDSTENKRADLMTTDQYENYEFAFDWKIAPQGNSGVIYRVTEEFDVPYASGPEYQLIDDVGYPGELKAPNKTGSNYDVHEAKNKTLNPPGEWNSSKIVVNVNHVEHWLNGVKVLEYELGSPDWKKRVAGSKWKDFPGYGLAKTGYIDLQDHGSEAWFRNIFIKVL